MTRVAEIFARVRAVRLSIGVFIADLFCVFVFRKEVFFGLFAFGMSEEAGMGCDGVTRLRGIGIKNYKERIVQKVYHIFSAHSRLSCA